MKAVMQDMQSGALKLAEVPPPVLQAGGILVRVRRSLISLGTERAIIALAKQTPIGKARTRPDLVRKVMNRARQEGLWDTIQVVRNLISSPIPLGYSCAGEVVAVGAEAAEFKVGDRVACAGLAFANHAEVNYIPRNLAVKLGDEVSYDAGSFVTVGTIALQGFRLAHLDLGGVAVVYGLGLVGQLAAQIAAAAGAVVIAYDPDPSKVELIRRAGIDNATSDSGALRALVATASDGHGADAVLVCAATSEAGPLKDAVDVARLKGRVVVVGDVGMNLERRPWFEKEVELVVSRSYGPGRYDPSYEVRGIDYPYAYVRWTERRNMQAFVGLLAQGRVSLDPLVTHRFPIAEAEEAYRLVTGERREPAVAIVLEYDGEVVLGAPQVLRRTATPAGKVRLGAIGAGQFAKGILLPAFRNHGAQIDAVCTASGLTARHAAETYGARICTSDPAAILSDPDIDAVVIATRHDHHAPLTVQALRAGKAVFVEKPLALTAEQLAEVAATDGPLMVGFNRRFSPLLEACRAHFAGRADAVAVTWRVNAGRLPPDSWVLDPVQGGGRILGEICHFVDAITFLGGAPPVRVFAEQVRTAGATPGDRDAVLVTLRLANGSTGAIQYFTCGDSSLAKEYVEVSGGGRSAVLDNFRVLSLHSGNRRRRQRLMLRQSKGHSEEVAAFLAAVSGGTPMPISRADLIAVSQATLDILKSLESGAPVTVVPPAGP